MRARNPSGERRRRAREGATFLQVAAVVAVVGSLLAAFVPTYVRQLRLSKISEASEHLALMHMRAAAYFAAEHDTERGPARHCLPPAAGPTPATPSVEPVEVAWDGSTLDAATWTALGFAPERPVRFSYAFEPATDGCGLRSAEGTYLVTFRANGDLDGDGVRSVFERRAAADPQTGELVPIGILYVRDRVE
ncbi:hypothetical protein [Sandaracinus amylolyticus]|uniref:Uncharacterized protein n=1 Tax=Sandaracinus amylolyticus TaxID=927083 RepID=A0A0F6W3Y2_9BACT|nr:hypothetical protein [Sandaracinus amylolyticus]AKF06875.1 hypothetical protein DB32_004024 [Sandaracinus amylolyticus]